MKTDDLYNEDYRSTRGLRRLKWFWLWWSYQFVLWLGEKTGNPYWWCGGRHTDGDPTVCQRCGYVCRRRDCVHIYQIDGAGDVERVDECPKCGSTWI